MKRMMSVLLVVALMALMLVVMAAPAFALNPQPIPPGVHGGYYFLHNVSDPGVTLE